MKWNLSEISRQDCLNFLSAEHYKDSLPSKVKCTGCFIDGQLTGVVGIYKASWFQTEIRYLYVAENYRNRGIGTNLVKNALEHIKTPVVAATVIKGNKPSMMIFLRLGFKEALEFINPATSNEVILLLKKL
ncbi:GNAT family N-acetyltransferase [Thermodesulfovibrio thiophilus]|uniref:GNAT family N-acetyltransferase n=1 Tax=Thermodesulfovibrio thiophilus TaxID=340095 RepID=UPI0004033068|nr:GNAT family N-acetyltransferase [Thermodesulfovibrio thiophilus]